MFLWLRNFKVKFDFIFIFFSNPPGESALLFLVVAEILLGCTSLFD
jgi:hypothetical protein